MIHSMTKTISKYYAKDVRNGAVYRIFDTPGFGDTDGIESDNKNVINIRKLFKDQIDEIHCVLFVLKCSVNKITTFQQYVFQTIMDLFGKDIAKNILFVFTFSDSGKPLVYNVIENPEKGFGKYLHLLEEPKYIEVNNCGIFQKIDPTDSIKTGYWAIGMSCISRLFEKVRAL